MITCGECRADLPEGARFCTSCGHAVPGASAGAGRPAAARPPAAGPLEDETAAVRLVECEECGAGNAASRALCARCNAPLRDEVPGGDALPHGDLPEEVPPAPAPSRGLDASPVLLALVILAGLVMAGALLALVTSRVRTPAADTVPEGVALEVLESSGAVPEGPVGRAVDGDPDTAWVTPPDVEVGASLLLGLPEDQQVRRILLWNGEQGVAAEDRHARVSALTVVVDDRRFRVDVLDIAGPQAIDLPDGLVADRVRLVVEEVTPGTQDGVAIGEVVVETSPA